MKVIDLFTGIGGFKVAYDQLPNFHTVAFCENDPDCKLILSKRYPRIPTWNDIKKLDHIKANVDLVTAGYPCQSVSVAGKKQGLADPDKTGLFYDAWRFIERVRPKYVLLENVDNQLRVDFDIVLKTIIDADYDIFWYVLPLKYLGGSHQRKRLFMICVQSDFYGKYTLNFVKEMFLCLVAQGYFTRTEFNSLPYLLPPSQSYRLYTEGCIKLERGTAELSWQKKQLCMLGNALCPHQAFIGLKIISRLHETQAGKMPTLIEPSAIATLINHGQFTEYAGKSYPKVGYLLARTKNLYEYKVSLAREDVDYSKIDWLPTPLAKDGTNAKVARKHLVNANGDEDAPLGNKVRDRRTGKRVQDTLRQRIEIHGNHPYDKETKTYVSPYLNPDFVEQMMGFSVGHTSLDKYYSLP